MIMVRLCKPTPGQSWINKKTNNMEYYYPCFIPVVKPRYIKPKYVSIYEELENYRGELISPSFIACEESERSSGFTTPEYDFKDLEDIANFFNFSDLQFERSFNNDLDFATPEDDFKDLEDIANFFD